MVARHGTARTPSRENFWDFFRTVIFKSTFLTCVFKAFVVYWLLSRVCLLGDLTDDEATGFFEPGTVAFSHVPGVPEIEPVIDWGELELLIQARHGINWWRGPDVELVSDWDELELVWAADMNWLEDPSMSSDNEDPFDIPFLPEL